MKRWELGRRNWELGIKSEELRMNNKHALGYGTGNSIS